MRNDLVHELVVVDQQDARTHLPGLCAESAHRFDVRAVVVLQLRRPLVYRLHGGADVLEGLVQCGLLEPHYLLLQMVQGLGVVVGITAGAVVQMVEGAADVLLGLVHRSIHRGEVQAAFGHVLLEQFLELGDALRLLGEFAEGRRSALECALLAQGVVHRHAQARCVVGHWPEHDVVVEHLAAAQLVGVMHALFAAQNDRAMRLQVDLRALAIQLQIELFGALQAFEGQHQYIRELFVEGVDPGVFVECHDQVLEFELQLVLDDGRIGLVVGGDHDGDGEFLVGCHVWGASHGL
ncbi:hypothetical protein D3C78_1083740 [compost metagenome]